MRHLLHNVKYRNRHNDVFSRILVHTYLRTRSRWLFLFSLDVNYKCHYHTYYSKMLGGCV